MLVPASSEELYVEEELGSGITWHTNRAQLREIGLRTHHLGGTVHAGVAQGGGKAARGW